uniref:Uncharacterized protein n=1 Tax=Hyaloperonospora arabidopsidis (strain Emoy2) TaxID=559515 RepID=M4B2L7_HYAAE
MGAQEIVFIFKVVLLSKPSVPMPISTPSSATLSLVLTTSPGLSSVTEAIEEKENQVIGGEKEADPSRRPPNQ